VLSLEGEKQMSNDYDPYDYEPDDYVDSTPLEKLISTVIVLLLLFGLGHMFGWGITKTDTVQCIANNNGPVASRDWRTQMSYRWIVPGKEKEHIYLIYETVANPIEVTLPFAGDHEVDVRVHTCMSLEEAEAAIQVSNLHSYCEVYEIARGYGISNSRFIWKGKALIFNKNDLFVAAESGGRSL
jgi:hypothetical protein